MLKKKRKVVLSFFFFNMWLMKSPTSEMGWSERKTKQRTKISHGAESNISRVKHRSVAGRRISKAGMRCECTVTFLHIFFFLSNTIYTLTHAPGHMDEHRDTHWIRQYDTHWEAVIQHLCIVDLTFRWPVMMETLQLAHEQADIEPVNYTTASHVNKH